VRADSLGPRLDVATTLAGVADAAPAQLAPGEPLPTSTPPTPPRRESFGDRVGRAPSSAWGGTVAFAADTWYVIKSPFRMNRWTVAWVAGTAVAAGALYANDQAIADAFVRSRGEDVYDAVIEVGNRLEPVGFMGRTNAYYFGALVTGYMVGWEPLVEIPAQLLESHFIAGGIRNLGKIVVGRTRPNEAFGPEHFDDGTSFPSGHASVMFEVATVLSHHAKSTPVTIVLYGLAGTVALQRVDAEQHWASDVLVACVVGTAVARTVVQQHEKRKLALAPVVAPSGAMGMGLVGRF
jgi:membrane-associated phospholipid phosphatase